MFHTKFINISWKHQTFSIEFIDFCFWFIPFLLSYISPVKYVFVYNCQCSGRSGFNPRPCHTKDFKNGT